jgi:hypothetical protein
MKTIYVKLLITVGSRHLKKKGLESKKETKKEKGKERRNGMEWKRGFRVYNLGTT